MKKNAFTLVELAIVLVIIGLLVGGILAGQSLIESARINKQISFFSEVDRAVSVFRLKYNALPGDYNKATLSFGSFSGTIANGNNNRELGNCTIRFSTMSGEAAQFWVHLNAAGLFSMPAAGDYGTTATGGIDFPKNPIENGSYSAIGCVLSNDDPTYYTQPALSELKVGSYLWLNTIMPSMTSSQVVHDVSGRRWLSSHAYAIDSKIDDGNALKGIFFAPDKFGNSLARGALQTGGSWISNNACRNASGNYINLSNTGGTDLGDAQVNHTYPCYLVFRLESTRF